MKNAAEIFRFVRDRQMLGQRCALVTITDVTGRSTRMPGTHMAVCENGDWMGSFSGGCIEAAVVAEAQRVIAQGQAELVRFGAGSRYIDIRLPCGGGIDLLFTPEPDSNAVKHALMELDARRPVALSLGADGTSGIQHEGAGCSQWHGRHFIASHHPDLRISIIGHGEEVLALSRLGRAYNADIEVLTPDPKIVRHCLAMGVAATILKTPRDTTGVRSDPWTAHVFLFHDHDWEPALLEAALEGEAFYVGAMGSRATQQARLASLLERGIPAARLSRLVGPIGTIHTARDPDTLALSVLAQVADRLRENGERQQPAPCEQDRRAAVEPAHRN
ncbi:XdhC family protein [Sphingobium sp.]|uniref:XdhC family protein n=1 Tax=Sphingobium sp. TaxID=1912891 RepID=UPI002B5136C2|nr:XdhC family protein [Sphingobium sp.]HUD94702.1 XdhC family protein [Sphingobium sp.]